MQPRFVVLVVLIHFVVALVLGFSMVFAALDWINHLGEWSPSMLLQGWGERVHFLCRQLLDPVRAPYAIAIVADILILSGLIGLWQARRRLLGKRPGYVLAPILIIGLGIGGFFATHFALDLILANHGGLTMIKANLMKLGMVVVAAWFIAYAMVSPLAIFLASRLRVPHLTRH